MTELRTITPMQMMAKTKHIINPSPYRNYTSLPGTIRINSISSQLNYNNMNFGNAIHFAKDGKRVVRAGWNGANMYVYIVPAGSYPPVTEIARQEFGDKVPYREYWALKTAQGDIATWAPSGSDSLAEDWFVYEPTVREKNTDKQVSCSDSTPSQMLLDINKISLEALPYIHEILSAIRK